MSGTLPGSSQQVVAGLVFDALGRVLIAQRPAGKHMAGSWEFPGGKRRAEESAQAALCRELSEEIGIRVERCRPHMQLQHDYPDRRIELDVWIVEDYQGEPQGLEGQALKWVPPAELSQEALLPADRPIIESLFARVTQRTPDGSGKRTAGYSAR